MTKVKSHTLYYDPLQNQWHLSLAAKALTKKKVYWGANVVPLPIMLRGKSSSLPSSHVIRTKSLLTFENKKPILGPLVGILTSKGKSNSFIGARKNFIDIIRTGAIEGAIVFVFTPEDVDRQSQMINGYLYQPVTKTWHKCPFPIPNVIYNRIPNRSLEKAPLMRDTLQYFTQLPGVTLFNPHFFNKQEIISILEKAPDINRHIPMTIALKKSSDLKDMFLTHSELYLKPTNGKAGVGIIKLEYDRHKQQYNLFYQTKQTQKKLSFKSFRKCWRNIVKLTINSPYIIQQAISLARYESSPFDVRTLVQKNKYGIWEVTGLGIRVAGENRITTHVPQGGRIEDTNQVLNHLFSEEKAKKIKEQIHSLAISIAQELERNYSTLAEMSMDIGVDQEGSLWFFEANAKPMKFDEPIIRRKSLQNLIHFAQYVTFVKSRGGYQLDAVAQAKL